MLKMLKQDQVGDITYGITSIVLRTFKLTKFDEKLFKWLA